jgi:monovalent cation/proton antiporter MnhG/PhaG subunit
MSVRDVIVYALLGLGVGCELLACLGIVAMRGVYDRLHYIAPSILGAILVAAAIWVREGPSVIALQATLLGLFLLAAGPVLTHATARAARISERGDWRRPTTDQPEPDPR